MSTYQSTDVVVDVVAVADDDDDFETNTGDGIISSLLISSMKKNRKLTILAATAFCGLSGIGLVSWNTTHTNNEQLRMGDIELLFGNDENKFESSHGVDAGADADAMNYDTYGCFELKSCESSPNDFLSPINYLKCYDENNSHVITYDKYLHLPPTSTAIYQNGPTKICPMTQSITQFLFGEDYIVGQCYDISVCGTLADDNTDLDCSITAHGQDYYAYVSLQCGDEYDDGRCKICAGHS